MGAEEVEEGGMRVGIGWMGIEGVVGSGDGKVEGEGFGRGEASDVVMLSRIRIEDRCVNMMVGVS